jgi:phosphonate transport system substrate-binding protein
MGETPIAFCGPVPYLKAKEKFNVTPILRALTKDGDSYYRGIIITREDSPIRNLADLKKKSFAFAQEWSTAGHILPRYHLLNSGIRLEDFKQYAFLRSHDYVIESVLTGEFDAGAVKDIVANKYKKQGLRYVYITDPIPTWSVIVRAGAAEEMIRSVKAALLQLNPKDPETRKMMAKWDEEIQYGFIETSPSDYDAIYKILKEVEQEVAGQERFPKQ